MPVAQRDFEILQGATFDPIVRWGSSEIVFKPVTNITQGAPAIVTAATHDLVDNWPVSFTGVVGMKEINAKSDPPSLDDLHHVKVVDANTISLKNLSTALYAAYVSGGFLRYNKPVDMTGYTARMSFRRNKKDTVPLLTLDTSNGGITLDNMNKRIFLFISAAATAAITWKRAYYDLEMVAGALNDANAIVDRILEGQATLSTEATK